MSTRELYENREPAWVKHWMLAHYLEVLIMKVCTHWKGFTYVDGFAGPWDHRSDDLSDTSFGVAIRVMRSCQEKFRQRGLLIPMKAVFYEIESEPARALIQYAKDHTSDELAIEAYNADFMLNIDAVAQALSPQGFAFIFIDPKGYKDMVPQRLAPLLKMRGVEVLINLMWDFINRFWDRDRTAKGSEQLHRTLDEIFGADRDKYVNRGDPERQVSRLYGQRLREAADGIGGRIWATAFPVQNATSARTHYFLVYVTHAAIGLLTFGEVAAKTWKEQAQTKVMAAIRRQATHTGDLFGGEVAGEFNGRRRVNDNEIRNSWMKRFETAGNEIIVTDNVLAELLEENTAFPADVQAALGTLVKAGIIENVTSSALKGKRSKHIVKPGERLRRLK